MPRQAPPRGCDAAARPPHTLYEEYLRHTFWSKLSLPSKVLVRHHRTGAIVALRRSHWGYQPAESTETPETFNAGITEDQFEGMYMGTFFSWVVVMADANVVAMRRKADERAKAEDAQADSESR